MLCRLDGFHKWHLPSTMCACVWNCRRTAALPPLPPSPPPPKPIIDGSYAAASAAAARVPFMLNRAHYTLHNVQCVCKCVCRSAAIYGGLIVLLADPTYTTCCRQMQKHFLCTANNALRIFRRIALECYDVLPYGCLFGMLVRKYVYVDNVRGFHVRTTA